MKVTVVPAQVTTVEDRIAGNLGLSQLLLLVTPVFGGCILYVILPPVGHAAVYKFVLMFLLLFACSLLAIRVRGKIVLFWLAVIVSYNLRPRYYLFDKHSLNGRETYAAPAVAVKEPPQAKPERQPETPALSVAERVRVENLMVNPAANLAFETRKGGLYVRIRQVKQES